MSKGIHLFIFLKKYMLVPRGCEHGKVGTLPPIKWPNWNGGFL